jgi:hypothetical protein
MRYNERMTAYRDIAGNSGLSAASNKGDESRIAERCNRGEDPCHSPTLLNRPYLDPHFPGLVDQIGVDPVARTRNHGLG